MLLESASAWLAPGHPWPEREPTLSSQLPPLSPKACSPHSGQRAPVSTESGPMPSLPIALQGSHLPSGKKPVPLPALPSSLSPPHSVCSPTRCDTARIAHWKADPSPNTCCPRLLECAPSPGMLLPIDQHGSIFCLVQVFAYSLLIRADTLSHFLIFLSFPSHRVYSLIELLNTYPVHWAEGS